MEMNYVAPEMEILEVMVECGFAGSVTGGKTDTDMEGPGSF